MIFFPIRSAIPARVFASICVIAGFLAAAGPAQAAVKCAAGPTVEKIGRDLIAAAKSKSRAKFHAILTRYGDVPYIATRALGKYRKKLPASQRKKYNRLVGLYMAKGLSEHARKFTGRSFVIVRCKGARVETSVQRGTRSHKIVWKLRKRGRYKIVDINVQNLWVAEALKSDLSRVMAENKGDYKALFSYLDKWSKQSW
jgi:ABC-type transporter MlaC component